MWAPLGRNSNSSHEAANCGYARTTTTFKEKQSRGAVD